MIAITLAPTPHLSTSSTRAARTKPSSGTLTNPLGLICVLGVLMAVRVVAALLNPIADCDETFNYWEPLHYLLHGFGLQTWEHSPEFALRSYALLYPYYAVARAAHYVAEGVQFELPVSPKIVSFYAVRVYNAAASALSESLLVLAARRQFGSYTAALLFLFLVGSAGQARAAPELLPSSFAMIAITLAFAAWMCGRRSLAVFLVALASLLGWIFAAVLGVPLALHGLLSSRISALRFIRAALVSGVIITAVMLPIDTAHFGKTAFAPLAHVLYNVFPREGTGSQLYGVEPWTYYPINLALNLNLQAALFALYPLQLLVQCVLFRAWRTDVAAVWRRCRFLAAPYVALAIFIAQPHKEERFLAPMYPLVSLVAAVALADALHTLCHFVQLALVAPRSRGSGIAAVPERAAIRGARSKLPLLARLIGVAVAAGVIALGASRAAMQIHVYGAPLRVYRDLSTMLQDNAARLPPGEVNVCVGNEWYRFASSFFLPEPRFRLRFVRAGFDGLLPKPYAEGRNGTRVVPHGFNEFNRADPAQFYDWQRGAGCHFLVDVDLSHRGTNTDNTEEKTEAETPAPVAARDRRVVIDDRFLDAELSPPGVRAVYVPGTDGQLVWARYVVVQNSRLVPEALAVRRRVGVAEYVSRLSSG